MTFSSCKSLRFGAYEHAQTGSSQNLTTFGNAWRSIRSTSHSHLSHQVGHRHNKYTHHTKQTSKTSSSYQHLTMQLHKTSCAMCTLPSRTTTAVRAFRHASLSVLDQSQTLNQVKLDSLFVDRSIEKRIPCTRSVVPTPLGPSKAVIPISNTRER